MCSFILKKQTLATYGSFTKGLTDRKILSQEGKVMMTHPTLPLIGLCSFACCSLFLFCFYFLAHRLGWLGWFSLRMRSDC